MFNNSGAMPVARDRSSIRLPLFPPICFSCRDDRPASGLSTSPRGLMEAIKRPIDVFGFRRSRLEPPSHSQPPIVHAAKPKPAATPYRSLPPCRFGGGDRPSRSGKHPAFNEERTAPPRGGLTGGKMQCLIAAGWWFFPLSSKKRHEPRPRSPAVRRPPGIGSGSRKGR